MDGTRISTPDAGGAAALRLLSRLVRDAPVGIALLDPGCRYLVANQTLAELNDVPLESHFGRTVEEVLPHLWPRLEPIYRRVLTGGEAVTDVTITGRAGSGSEDRHWLANYYPVADADGETVGIGVALIDVTQRVRSEESLRAILSALPDLIFTLESDGTHSSFHAPSREDLYVEPDEILGRTVRETLPGAVADRYEEALRRTLELDEMQEFEYALDFGDDDRRVFDARMVPKGESEVLVVARDVTEVRELEARFRQAQKMEAIGRLAGGVAHDFNNLLTVINASADLLLRSDGEGVDARQLLEEIRDAGRRAAALTNQLLLFTRQQVVEPRVLQLNQVVSNTEKMLRRLLGERFVLETRLDPDVPPVRADPGQIEQALLNLCVNARDAMPDGGTVVIRTAAREEGSQAVLSVSDSGVGMDEAVRERMFEPFFTTKAPGKGSGLGLSVVFGVMEDSGGRVDVDSTPGQGTTVYLRFPGASEPAAKEARARPLEMPRGSETVLLVEDDPAVRGVVRRCLKLCGYTVLEAAHGPEALELSGAYQGSIALLLTDVVMPHMGGRELAERLQSARPELVVLLMSGHTDDALVQEAVLTSDLMFLQKPFSPAVLATKVRTVLDRSQT